MNTTELRLDTAEVVGLNTDPALAGLVMPDTFDVILEVPTAPSVRDLAVAYRKKVQRELELAEEAVFDRELELANAQRIALAARARVTVLHTQLTGLDLQISQLTCP